MALFGNNDANYLNISGTAAGTVVIKAYNPPPNNSAGHLYGVYVTVPLAGTVTYWDGQGTANGSIIAQVSNNGTKVPDLFAFNCRFTNGLFFVASAGSYNQSVFWD